MQTTATPQAVTTRPKGDVTIYFHKELLGKVDKLLKAQRKAGGKKTAKSVSQFFERCAIRLIREEGRKHSIKLPEDLAD